MTSRRVVITGLGMLTPLGVDVASTWEGIKAGKSGIRNIEHFDTEPFATRFAGLVPEFDIADYLSPKDARKMDVFVQYGLVAAIQAVRCRSGYGQGRCRPCRAALALESVA